MFAVGDRVRVVEFFKSRTAKMVGVTGTVTFVARKDQYAYNYHVRLDRPQKVYGTWSKREVLELLFHPEELEYEDNRKGAMTYDILGWGGGSTNTGDYVRLNNGLTNCRCAAGSKHPLAHVFQLFTNYRQGDSALHVTCLGCGTVSGHVFNNVTPADVDNLMYACVEPSLYYDIEPRNND